MQFRPLFSALFAIASLFALPAAAQSVGFESLTMDGVEVGIWYPAAGTHQHLRLGLYAHDVVPNAAPVGDHLPLVVISHGSGGHFSGHVDSAVALAREGFVVAALTHPGDNWKDQSRATDVADRPAALSALIGYMLTRWPAHDRIDAKRVGAFGFSSGGFTVLAAAGGRPDLTRMAAHCAQYPGFYDCRMLKAHASGATAVWPQRRDARIKAIVVAAPALGFTFDKAGLRGVTIPVQLWRADADTILPAPLYADAVRRALPRAPEFHSVPAAGHFDFLAPCETPTAAPQICTSAAGFDRVAFHAGFNDQIVRFFKRTLK